MRNDLSIEERRNAYDDGVWTVDWCGWRRQDEGAGVQLRAVLLMAPLGPSTTLVGVRLRNVVGLMCFAEHSRAGTLGAAVMPGLRGTLPAGAGRHRDANERQGNQEGKPAIRHEPLQSIASKGPALQGQEFNPWL